MTLLPRIFNFKNLSQVTIINFSASFTFLLFAWCHLVIVAMVYQCKNRMVKITNVLVSAVGRI